MDPGRFRPQAPAVPGPPPPPPRTRREGETPEGPHDPANGELVPCEASSPLPQPPRGSGRSRGAPPAEPRTERRPSGRSGPAPAAGTGRAQPHALPPPPGSVGAGQALGTAGCGAPFVKRLDSPFIPVTIPAPAPAPRSKEHMFPLGLLARLTTSHGQGKAAPGTKAESGIWNVNARGSSDGGCRRKRSFSPFSVLGRRFSVNCRYHNAALLPAQVSRGDSLHSLTCHS